jgi:hypothetical protein
VISLSAVYVHCHAQVVALSMALTPYLAEFGAKLGQMLEKGDVKALQPQDSETQVGGTAGVERLQVVNDWRMGAAEGAVIQQQQRQAPSSCADA